MSLHLKSCRGGPEGSKRTHRSQFHIFRIVGDLPPEECLPLAIDGLWRMITREIGADAARTVGLGNISVEARRVIVRIWTPVDHADYIAKLPMTFDADGWQEELREICWRKPDRAANEMRRRALEAHRSQSIATTEQMGAVTVVDHDPDDVPVATGDDAYASEGTLVRISVPWKGVSKAVNAGRRYGAITAFLKSSCTGMLRTSPGSMRIVGTIEQPSSTSLVVELPQNLALRIERMASSVRVTAFSKNDLHTVDRRSAYEFATVMKCRIHHDYANEARSITVASDGLDEPRGAVADRWLRPSPVVRATRHDALHRAWRLMAGVLDLMLLPFEVLIALDKGLGKTSPRIVDHAPNPIRVWTLLERALPDEPDRILICRTRCDEFERVAARWGDARSAETSSSVTGLLDRLAAEMADMVEWSLPQEVEAAAKDVLDTLERLGLRAEEERRRLVSGLRGRLDTTRRFVELKLDDSELASIPDLRQAS